MVCSASDSSSGLAGSAGQIPVCGVVGLPGLGEPGVGLPAPSVLGAGAGVTTASGMTAATPGSAARLFWTFCGTVAANAFRTVYWRVTRPPDAEMRAISGRRWRAWAALRALTLEADASRAFCCVFNTTMTRLLARAVRMICARESPWWNLGTAPSACEPPARTTTASAGATSRGTRCIPPTSLDTPAPPVPREDPRDPEPRPCSHDHCTEKAPALRPRSAGEGPPGGCSARTRPHDLTGLRHWSDELSGEVSHAPGSPDWKPWLQASLRCSGVPW